MLPAESSQHCHLILHFNTLRITPLSHSCHTLNVMKLAAWPCCRNIGSIVKDSGTLTQPAATVLSLVSLPGCIAMKRASSMTGRAVIKELIGFIIGPTHRELFRGKGTRFADFGAEWVIHGIVSSPSAVSVCVSLVSVVESPSRNAPGTLIKNQNKFHNQSKSLTNYLIKLQELGLVSHHSDGHFPDVGILTQLAFGSCRKRTRGSSRHFCFRTPRLGSTTTWTRQVTRISKIPLAKLLQLLIHHPMVLEWSPRHRKIHNQAIDGKTASHKTTS